MEGAPQDARGSRGIPQSFGSKPRSSSTKPNGGSRAANYAVDHIASRILNVQRFRSVNDSFAANSAVHAAGVRQRRRVIPRIR